MHLVAQPHTAVGARQDVNRHWLTAGAVLASAAVIAAAPGISPIPVGAQHDIQAGAVRLTAGWDPLAPLQTALETAQANGTALADNFLLAPGVGLQQAIVNQIGYAKQLFDDPSSFEAVSQQFAANAMKVAAGLTLIGADAATSKAVLKHTLGGMHGMALTMFPQFLAEDVDVETFSAVMNVLSSPLSGVLIGFAGPVLSPAVALANSATEISNALQAGDPEAALSSLLGIPTGMVDAFLNGTTLNLDALAPMVNDAGLMKDGVTIDKLNLELGGLLTPGSTDRNPYEVKDEEGNVIKTIPSVGGSIFNSLGMGVKLGALGISVEGEAVGPIGALQGLSQTVGVLLGSGWDDWNGKGNAPAPKPPLLGLDPLVTGDILSDTAESAGVTKLRDMLKGAAIDKIAKQLQGLATGTESATDDATATATAVAATVDGTVDEATPSTGVAAATELTHATAKKMVPVSVIEPSAPAAAESATTATNSGETEANTDETATKPTESDATSTKTVKTRTQPKLVKDIKAAVKNVRTGLTGSKTETTDSSSKTDSTKAGDAKTGETKAGDSKTKVKSSDTKSKNKAKAKSKD